MKRNIKYSLLYILFICITACEDKLLEGEDDFTPGAKSSVLATVEFKPLVPALNGTSRTKGNTIKTIDSIWMLLYDMDGKLVKDYKIEEFNQTLVDQKDLTSRGPYAEAKTYRATFNLTIPQGRYYIYAVANLDLTFYQEAIQTVEGLKAISLSWQEDITKNNQMFGHFSEDSEENKNVIHGSPELLTINKNMKLHAWVRRAASKVTIAYDGSQLEEGVFIYLKSVKIKDIPKTCSLGKNNTIDDVKNLIATGETINYHPEPSLEPIYDETWPARITAGVPYYPYTTTIENGKTVYKMDPEAHSETADALFFYENMQGEGESKKQAIDGVITKPVVMGEDGNYKKDENGNVIYDPGSYKDQQPYGTYIEVEAYYSSINEKRVGNGKIIYRFMLGKNTDKDYDAERNYHYKLTLHFNRFANDIDWHIEYEEDIPSIQVPEPYYISYLYNHDAIMPVKINVGKGYELYELKAEIDSNAWAPYKPKDDFDYYKKMDPAVTPGAPLNPWNGFLSLRKTKVKVIPFPASSSITQAQEANKKYYEDHQRGTRTYFKNGSLNSGDSNETDGTYEMKREDNNAYTFRLPIYTRAKQLIIKTGYTGNNPYVAYQRKANVKFTATLKSKEGDETKIITQNASIMQVRRVVNPKGVWRKAGNNTPFHVVLKRLPSESSKKFESFRSEGAWRAYVVRGDKNFITLDGGSETSGKTGSLIDFTIGFRGETKENESRNAIIRIEYHNYSCVHLIFVRQGKAPMALVANGSKWLTCNMRTKDQEAECPLEEGSMFKFGNWNDPIDATENKNDNFSSNKLTNFKIAGTENITKKWEEIPSSTYDGNFPTTMVNGTEVTVASYNDYNMLWESDDIEQGFGILYGNDATETLSDIDEVYGHRYDRHGTADNPGAGYGMRGVFVYNKSEDPTYGGRNLFFPIGTTGYGRRKNLESWKTAVLRYAGRTEAIPESEYLADRPLFYDLYLRPGAIYWLNQRGDLNGEEVREAESIGWDFNYFTFDFNVLSASNVFTTKDQENQSHACFIRCVTVK